MFRGCAVRKVLAQARNKQKMNWVRLAEHGRIPTNAKYMNPRISFDGLNWWISVWLSGEAHCRADLNLQGAQIELIAALAKTGKPVVTVVMAGRPLTIGKGHGIIMQI